MRTFFYIALAFVLTWSAMSVQGKANDTISVVVSGVGRDSAEANKNALRAAVEQAVGSIIDTETLVKNEEVISDKILSFSAGYVKSYKQLGEPKTENGLVSVRISAEVKRNELDSQLRSAGVVKVQVDGRSLAAQAITKEMSREDGIEMLIDMLEKFPMNVYETATDWRYDVDSRKTVVEIETKIDTKKYAAFVKEFTDLLRKVGGRRTTDGTGIVTVKRLDTASRVAPPSFASTRVTPTSSVSLTTSSTAFPRALKDNLLAIADKWPNLTRAGQEAKVQFNSYDLPEDVYGMIRPMFISRSMVVEAVDSNGRVLATGKVKPPMPSRPFGNYRNFLLMFPSLHVDTGGLSGNIAPGTLEHKLEMPLDIPRDDLEKISAVQISME